MSCVTVSKLQIVDLAFIETQRLIVNVELFYFIELVFYLFLLWLP